MFENNKKMPSRLLLSAAVAAVIMTSYTTRPAVAGSCTGASGDYTCTGGVSTDTTQNLSGSPLSVTTSAGFSILTTIGDAFTLVGTQGINF